jgi:hypothetical protein
VVDLDGSPHSMTAQATIAASPKLVADLVELIAETLKAVVFDRDLAELFRTSCRPKPCARPLRSLLISGVRLSDTPVQGPRAPAHEGKARRAW